MKCHGGSDRIADELHGLKLGLKILYSKVNDLQDSVKDLRSSSETQTSATRELVRHLSEEIKKIEGKPTQITQIRELVRHLSEEIKKIEGKPTQITQIVTRPVPDICDKCETTKFAMRGVVGGVLVVAIVYGYLSAKGISMSDMLNGTKSSVASYMSLITKHLGQKSSALTEKLRHLTEQIENYGKLADQNEMLTPKKNEVCTVFTSPTIGQEYSDMLFNLVMEEAPEFDEEFLGNVFDYLNENHVAARGFISKSPNMRKKWLGEFAKRSFVKI